MAKFFSNQFNLNFLSKNYEVLVVFVLSIILPLSLESSQNWQNILPIRYVWLLCFSLISIKHYQKIGSLILIDFKFYSFILIISILASFQNNYFEFSFISLAMTVFILRVLSQVKFNFLEVWPTLLLCILFFLIKAPFYTWDSARINFGLGNPNHVGYLVSCLFFLCLWKKKYTLSSLFLLIIFGLRSWGAILSSFFIIFLFIGYKYSFRENLFRRINLWIVFVSVLLVFLLYVCLFYIVFHKELDEFYLHLKNLHELNLFKRGGTVWSFGGNNMFDLSGFTRFAQFERFINWNKLYLILGNEKNFMEGFNYTPHNTVLGLFTVFGFPTALYYMHKLGQIFKYKAFYFFGILPILSVDTVTNIYGLYFTFFSLTVFLMDDSSI
jgi:hypothetical protein